MSLLTIILSILIPPLAVFLKHGLGTTFLVNLILTIIFWVPGAIHALWVNSKG
ncbi:YqaE/Pmp3 family membrane protein [Fulvivirga ligni]|uniref:YqaE/Pmp3 family membrane protein n=1 Tax=Fulvivirga ligni TaxID=2904246 RepID=UPI001F36DA57|nr:YqaE/Pmp3 family membrane protein [Fulvivirga ligni]UII24296.1 YqaE/Pmp3 family membrane protein [Fulvivirga ligni]